MALPPPSVELYNKVRGAFIAQGRTLKDWAAQNKTHQSNVRSALTGMWDGPKGREMRRRLIKEAGLEKAS